MTGPEDNPEIMSVIFAKANEGGIMSAVLEIKEAELAKLNLDIIELTQESKNLENQMVVGKKVDDVTQRAVASQIEDLESKKITLEAKIAELELRIAGKL